MGRSGLVSGDDGVEINMTSQGPGRNLEKEQLGMMRPITRRDFVGGVAAMSVAALASGCASRVDPGSSEPGGLYPPSLTGLRGNHPGSFDVAHDLAFGTRRSWPDGPRPESHHDLVVVGAGLSGLSAAMFYRGRYPGASVLILDNHDDFGGHARRNEFDVDGRHLISYGGSQTLQAPSGYPEEVKGLLADLGIEPDRFYSAYDQDFYRRNGLRAGIHFDSRQWGIDRVVPFNWGAFEGYLPLAENDISVERAVASMPLSESARQELLRLFDGETDWLEGVPEAERPAFLYRISYRAFLEEHMGIRSPEIYKLLHDISVDSSLTIDSVNAYSAINWAGLPGQVAARLPYEPGEPYIHHFPDGNAGVARAMVGALIPGALDARDMDDLVRAQVNYRALDAAGNEVRLRLNSTVVRAENHGDGVTLAYVENGRTQRINAGGVVMACYNAAIPHLCPEVGREQTRALKRQVKTPILYTSVALRHWRGFAEKGIGAATSPGGYHTATMLDFPVSMGGYQYSASPDEPVVVHMERFPMQKGSSLPPADQFRASRAELLATPFEDMEMEIRLQLASLLSGADFDAARDIAGITVNRWAHGYASWYNPLFEAVYDDDDDPRYPHVQARKPLGRITIANSDAGASALFESAVMQAWRAVEELG